MEQVGSVTVFSRIDDNKTNKGSLPLMTVSTVDALYVGMLSLGDIQYRSQKRRRTRRRSRTSKLFTGNGNDLYTVNLQR